MASRGHSMILTGDSNCNNFALKIQIFADLKHYTKTTYKIVQCFVSFWLSHRRKCSTAATATTVFFSLTKPNPEASGQNILDYFINRSGINFIPLIFIA